MSVSLKDLNKALAQVDSAKIDLASLTLVNKLRISAINRVKDKSQKLILINITLVGFLKTRNSKSVDYFYVFFRAIPALKILLKEKGSFAPITGN